MSDKSYVTVEQHVCRVCGIEYDTGSILLDKRLRPAFDRSTTTGWGLCHGHQRLFDEGYVALVGVDEAKSRKQPSGNVKPEDAHRTGSIAHVKRDVARRLFNVPIADDLPMMFCDEAVINKLQEITPE